MGNQETSPSVITSQAFSISAFERSYSYEKEINDPRFGIIKIFKNKAKPENFAMSMTKNSLDGNFENFTKELAVRSQLKHENMCKILGNSQESLQKMCGATSSLTVYAEFEKSNLEKELQKKSSNKVYFNSFL